MGEEKPFNSIKSSIKSLLKLDSLAFFLSIRTSLILAYYVSPTDRKRD